LTTLIDRHIGTYVIWGSALVLFVLMTLFAFTEFVEDLDSVGRGDYTLLRAFEHMALKMPGLAYQLFPIAALIGSLLGLGVLAGNSELVVLRASGVSTLRIALSVMKAAALLMLIAVIIGEVVAPMSERAAEQRESLAVGKMATRGAGQGFWMRDGASFINVREVLPNEKMAAVYIYDFDGGQRLRTTSVAARAHYEGERWILEELRQSLLSEELVERREVSKTQWSSIVEPGLVDVITVNPESLSVLGLYKYMGYLQDNNLSTARYELALWMKLVAPFATGVMIFLSIPLVLGRLGSVGLGQRIVVGILVGMVFYVLQQVAAQSGIVYGLTPMVSAVTPTLLFLGAGVWLMRSVR
jgi:lipopolysaccharide export system permease protein